MQSEYAQHNDAILLVIIPAAQAPEVSSAKALRIAKEYDGECAFTLDPNLHWVVQREVCLFSKQMNKKRSFCSFS